MYLIKNIQMRIFKTGFRYISSNKLTSLVSILGLSIGLTLTIYLTLFIKNELSYDRFHPKHDRIYRVLGKETALDRDPEYIALCQGQFPMHLNTIPEVESTLRILAQGYVDMEFDNTRITKNHLIYADSTFFNFFSFKVLSGNPLETLKDPNGLLICKSLAIKAFSTLDIIGRSAKIGGKVMTIGGVLEDVPENSHLQFNMLSGSNNPLVDMLVKHSGNEFYTYVLLKENVEKKSTLDKICMAYNSFSKEYWKDSNFRVEGLLQPLNDIELHSDNLVWDVPHGNMQNIYLATALIIFILIVAIINVVNLFTVNAETHVKEVGMRKASGASRFDMIKKYMGESVIITFLSLILAFLFVRLSWVFFNNFIGKNIIVSALVDLKFILVLVLLSLIIGAISGIYPALYLSRFSIVRILKGATSKGGKISPLIKGMVLTQFFIVISLVSCLLIFYRQMSYVKNKNLGFNKEYVAAINGLTNQTVKSYSVIREKLLQNDGIVNISLAQGIADDEMSGQFLSRIGGETGGQILTKHTRTTEDFIKTFGIEIIDGRDFSKAYPTDKNNFILNEAACKALGFQGSAVGKQIAMNDTGTVIGVVKDFNFASLHNKIAPLVLTFEVPRGGTIYVRLKPEFIKNGLDLIYKSIKSVDPYYSLDYEFVDDQFNRMYLQEAKVRKMLLTTAVISILLALMGLVALTSMTIIRRVKEIGIRKVNGASVIEVLLLLNKDFSLWVLLAFLFAIPISWVVMHKWLEGFAFSTTMSWWIFALSGLSMLVASLVTVTSICWRSATRNPVEALRYE
jgi:putative ABC transport system permease protein